MLFLNRFPISGPEGKMKKNASQAEKDIDEVFKDFKTEESQCSKIANSQELEKLKNDLSGIEDIEDVVEFFEKIPGMLPGSQKNYSPVELANYFTNCIWQGKDFEKISNSNIGLRDKILSILRNKIPDTGHYFDNTYVEKLKTDIDYASSIEELLEVLKESGGFLTENKVPYSYLLLKNDIYQAIDDYLNNHSDWEKLLIHEERFGFKDKARELIRDEKFKRSVNLRKE